MMLIDILYQLIQTLGYTILLGGYKLGDEVLDLSGVDTKYSGCRADAEFI